MKSRLSVLAFLAAFLILSPCVLAGRILVVSDAKKPTQSGGDHEDDELVAFLGALGHTVDTTGMDKAFQGDFWTKPANVAAIATADLIIVSRRTSSGSYNRPVEWNSIRKPVLLMSGYLTRSSRWGWTTSESGDANKSETDMEIASGQEGHPFVAGLTSPVGVFDWSPGSQRPGETVVGLFDNRPFLMDIPAGLYLGASYGTTGARRAFLGHWGYDTGGQDYRFDDFITSDYERVLTNVINEIMIPEPATCWLLGVSSLLVARRLRSRHSNRRER